MTENMKLYLEQIEMYESVPTSGKILPEHIPSNLDLNIDNFHFNFSMAGARLFIYGNSNIEYDIMFVDNDTNSVKSIFKTTSNTWVASYEDYYVNWRIDVKPVGADISETKSFIQDLYNKNVLIRIETSALGDNIAFIPVIEEFRKKHNCEVTVVSLYKDAKDLFKPYDITVLSTSDEIKNVEYKYSIGWYGKGNAGKRNKRNCADISLQQIAADALGISLDMYDDIPFKDVKTTMAVVKEKYVVISPFSTAQMKLWNNDCFQEIVDYLNTKNIRTVVIGNGTNYLNNIIDYTGMQSIGMLRNLIYHSIFGIFLPSGLSWLNWSMKKKTIMITGISKDYCEFKNDIFRVEPMNSSCTGCFNNKDIIFDRFDWDFCVNEKEKFECTKKISFEQVKDIIEKISCV